MTVVDSQHAPHRSSDETVWQGLRPVTIFVTDEQFATITALLDREPRYLPRLAAFLATPSVSDGEGKSGENPTPQ